MNAPGFTSRRTFLAALGAAAFAPRALRAAVLPPLDFVVITDTHLGYQDSPSAEKRWHKTAAEVDKAPGAFVLHLGDVVDGGREEQYPRYLEGRKLIRKPVHEIPGNHDPQEKFERHIRKPVDMIFDHQWLRLVMINNSRPESHDGFISPEQIQWMSAHCDDAAKKDLRLLFAMHVPVHSNAHPDRGWHVKPAEGQTAFYKLLQTHAARTLALFHGHFHNGIRGWEDRVPVHEIIFPSALYNQDRKLAAAHAPGYNLAEFRPGYTTVAIREGVMTLDYHVTGTADRIGVQKKIA